MGLMDRAVRQRPPTTPPRAPATSPGATPAGALLALQRAAGNQAVSRALAGAGGPVIQRLELATRGGGLIADYDGAGTNRPNDVLGVQERLLVLWSITNEAFAAERKTVLAKGETDPLLAADIKLTLAAITRNDGPHLSAATAQGAFKAALVGGVGQGQTNNATDVELMLNLMHEEGHVTNKEYDDGRVVLTGAGATVDPAAVPGFLAGLTKLKRGYVAGYPFRGSTGKRKNPVAPEGPDQKAYEKAIAHNIAERAVMQNWLDEAKKAKKDVRLRNSAEWFTTGKVLLFALTLTHDSDARAKASGQRGKVALFSYPGGPLGQPPAPYVRKAKGTATYTNTDVDFQAPAVDGFHTGNHITVVEPTRGGKAQFRNTIKHEAQHDADKSGDTDTERFQSEFRAYWLTGTFDHLSPRKRIKRLGFTWNERQFGIFQHLMAAPVSAYPYMRKNWNTNVTGWRAMVVGFSQPVSINPVNSVRIENLREAIDACSPTDCLADDRAAAAGQPRNPKATAVRAAMDGLDATDRKGLGKNQPLKQLAQTHLAGSILATYLAVR